MQHVDPAAYARACAEAWNYFIDQGGTAMLGHREPNTGDRVKDPAIISELTANGSDIEDWRKWEWGPFTIDGLDFVVHAFKNIDTQEVKTDTALGYKVKFRTEIPPGWGT